MSVIESVLTAGALGHPDSIALWYLAVVSPRVTGHKALGSRTISCGVEQGRQHSEFHKTFQITHIDFDFQSIKIYNKEARLFCGNEICVITPYREQATMIRQSLFKAGANENWFE